VSEEIIEKIKKLIENIISGRIFNEIFIHPDPDSLVTASFIIRLLGSANKEIGVVSYEESIEPSDKSLLIGFGRPKKGSKGFLIGRDKTFSLREDKYILIPYRYSLTKIFYEASKEIYRFPREFREFALASHLHNLSPSEMIHRVGDNELSANIDAFGSDVAKIIYGLKLMSFYDESYLENTLFYTIDPYIPGISGNIEKIRMILESLGSGRGKEYLQRVSGSINNLVRSNILSLGSKPYFDLSPFIDPYEIIRALDIFMNKDIASTALYIASGISGIAYLATKFRERLDSLIGMINKIIGEKTYEIISHKINNLKISEFYIKSSSCDYDLLYEIFVISKDLGVINDPLIVRCGEKYLYPWNKNIIFSPESIESVRGMFLVFDSIKSIGEIEKYVESRD